MEFTNLSVDNIKLKVNKYRRLEFFVVFSLENLNINLYDTCHMNNFKLQSIIRFDIRIENLEGTHEKRFSFSC